MFRHNSLYYVVVAGFFGFLIWGVVSRMHRGEGLAAAAAYYGLGILEFFGGAYKTDAFLPFARAIWLFGGAVIIVSVVLRRNNS